MEAVYGVILLIAAGIALVLIRRAIGAGIHKGVDVAANAIKREQEKKNPPVAESLADRYASKDTEEDG